MTTPSEELGRLRDEGIDLDDEVLLGGYDLEKMRAVIDARTGGADPPSGGGGAVASLGIAAAAALLFGLGWSMLGEAVPETPSALPVSGPGAAVSAPAPVAAPAPAAEAPRPAREPRATPRPARAPAAAPSVIPTALDGSGTVDAQPIPVPHPLADSPGTAEDSEPPIASGGDLAAQTALFEAGRAAISAGQLSVAAGTFQEYLQRWPEGVYANDALVSILELAIRGEAWDAVEPLAAQLSQVPALAARRTEFVRARGEALVHLGRCTEALVLAETLGRSDGAVIRKSCRTGVAR